MILFYFVFISLLTSFPPAHGMEKDGYCIKNDTVLKVRKWKSGMLSIRPFYDQYFSLTEEGFTEFSIYYEGVENKNSTIQNDYKFVFQAGHPQLIKLYLQSYHTPQQEFSYRLQLLYSYPFDGSQKPLSDKISERLEKLQNVFAASAWKPIFQKSQMMDAYNKGNRMASSMRLNFEMWFNETNMEKFLFLIQAIGQDLSFPADLSDALKKMVSS